MRSKKHCQANPVKLFYILKQAGKPLPSIAFLPTASGDSDRYIVNFYAAFTRLDCIPSHLVLFQRTVDLRSYLLRQDVIYVGGGNTKSMLGVWREWRLPELFEEAWKSGVILAGLSAGAICWFQQGITDAWVGKLTVLDGLGFLEGSCCPHYDGEPERRPAYHQFMTVREISPGYGVEDGAALHFSGKEILRVVISRPGARAYRVAIAGDQVEEEALPAEYLGK